MDTDLYTRRVLKTIGYQGSRMVACIMEILLSRIHWIGGRNGLFRHFKPAGRVKEVKRVEIRRVLGLARKLPNCTNLSLG
jgi:hypothetical protein